MLEAFFFTRGAMGPFESMNNPAFVTANHATLSSNLLVILIFGISRTPGNKISVNCVCVCVYVSREIEREKERDREMYVR